MQSIYENPDLMASPLISGYAGIMLYEGLDYLAQKVFRFFKRQGTETPLEPLRPEAQAPVRSSTADMLSQLPGSSRQNLDSIELGPRLALSRNRSSRGQGSPASRGVGSLKKQDRNMQPPALPSKAFMQDRQLSRLGFPRDLIPEAFLCAISAQIMDAPVRLPLSGQLCDGYSVLQALQRKKQNPFSRQPMTNHDPKPDLVLRAKIKLYVKELSQRLSKAGSSSQAPLSLESYKVLNNEVLAQLALTPMPSLNLPRTSAVSRSPR